MLKTEVSRGSEKTFFSGVRYNASIDSCLRNQSMNLLRQQTAGPPLSQTYMPSRTFSTSFRLRSQHAGYTYQLPSLCVSLPRPPSRDEKFRENTHRVGVVTTDTSQPQALLVGFFFFKILSFVCFHEKFDSVLLCVCLCVCVRV